MDNDNVGLEHERNEQATASYEVSDEVLEDVAKGGCSAGRLMLSATDWGCPC
jgi:hypothetical protein